MKLRYKKVRDEKTQNYETNTSSAVQPVVLSLCDIMLLHRDIHLHNSIPISGFCMQELI